MVLRLLRSISVIVTCGTLLAAHFGCSVYEGRSAYVPKPADVAAVLPDAGQVRTLATVIGIRRADAESGLPASIEIRLRIENEATAPIVFEPSTLALVAADLTTLPPPIVEPATTVELEPGGMAMLTAYFPLPEPRGSLDISGLSLRWSIRAGDETVTSSTSFTRLQDFTQYPYHHHHRIGMGIGYRTCF